MLTPFPLILISSPEDFADEHVLVEAMFRRGLACLHLRKPLKDSRALEQWLFELEPEFRSRVVVHGHEDLVVPFGLAGFHGGPGAKSISVHSFSELEAESVLRDYAFLSPIFDSYSKPGYLAAFGEKDLRVGLKMWRSSAPHPIQQIFALGGIDAERLESVRDYGFDGAAILGAVWNAFNPLAAWDALWSESHRVVGLSVPNLPAIESWRDHLQKRRGNVNDF